MIDFQQVHPRKFRVERTVFSTYGVGQLDRCPHVKNEAGSLPYSIQKNVLWNHTLKQCKGLNYKLLEEIIEVNFL